MKKNFKLLFIAIAAVALSSCNFGGKEPNFQLSDLQGLWLEKGDTTLGHYVRFTTEQSNEPNYLYGREWTESDDVFEDDLRYYRVDSTYVGDSLVLDSVAIPGNGWFKYQLESKGDLHEIHLMSNDGAEIPKEYIVAILTDTRLEYYEKDDKNRRSYFNKVVEVVKD